MEEYLAVAITFVKTLTVFIFLGHVRYQCASQKEGFDWPRRDPNFESIRGSHEGWRIVALRYTRHISLNHLTGTLLTNSNATHMPLIIHAAIRTNPGAQL